MTCDVHLKLRYVYPERMRSGRWRYRFQRGRVKATLPGKPGSPEFMAEYNRLVDGTPRAAPRVRQGSIRWLAELYLDDLTRRVHRGDVSRLTLKGHEHHLRALIEAHGDMHRDMPAPHLQRFIDRFADTPGTARNRRKAVSAMYQWAVPRGHAADNPARHVKPPKPRRAGGFATWTADDFAAYLHRHPPGTNAHLCMALAISTLARREDLRLMGRQHETRIDGRCALRWRQSKAPHRTVEMPMTAMLQDAVDRLEGGALTYLVKADGQPYTHGGIGNRFRAWCAQAGVGDDKSLHGVRKGVMAILAARGAGSLALDVLAGHEMDSGETAVYVRDAERLGLMASAIDMVDGLDFPHAAPGVPDENRKRLK